MGYDLDSPGQAGAEDRLSGNGGFEPLHRLGSLEREAPYHGDGRHRSNGAGLAAEYARGAISLVYKADSQARPNTRERRAVSSATHNHITFYGRHNGPIGPYDLDGRVAGRSKDRREGGVLVRVIKQVEIIEIVSSAARKGFRCDEGVFHPLTGCFYSLAGGFEVDPIVACRKFEVAILRAAVAADHVPNCVVEGAPRVVDSIAYYKGEGARRVFEKFDGGHHHPRVLVGLNDKSVWFGGDELGELPFQVRDVILGPLDFLFGAFEHAEAS